MPNRDNATDPLARFLMGKSLPTIDPVPREVLAEALRREAFDPEGEGFDMATALASGMRPFEGPGPNQGHFGSVVQATPEQVRSLGLPEDSFMVLKGRKHPTFDKAVTAETARGFRIIRRGDRFFSVPMSFVE